MKRYLPFYFSVMIIVSLLACGEQPVETPTEVDNFNGYISGYSASPVSRCGDIFVQLAFVPDSSHMASVNWYEVLYLKPQTEIASWYDHSTNRVIISEPGLKYNQKYMARLNLGALTEVPKELEFFDFDIEAKVQAWNFHASHPEIKSMEQVEYKGWVTYEDCEPDRTVFDQGFTAKQGSRVLPVSWSHPEKEKKKSYFTIKDIKRTDKQEVIEITLSMDVIGENESASHELIIPSKADFSFMKHKIPDNDHIALYFSDPLDPKQKLEGLIDLKGRKIIRYNIDFNRVDLYLESNKYGYFDLDVRQGIKNIGGFPFKDAFTKSVFFAPPKPFVRFAEKGHILPPENSWKVPVEMVSASGFRLRILKVFEHNVHQYFQENPQSLNSQRDLEKVGRIVLDTIYDIKSEDLFNQSVHLIDLGRQVRREPRALYKLFLTIPTEHNAYPCDDTEIISRQDRVDRMSFDKPGGSVWYDDYAGEYYYDYYGYSEEFYDMPSESHEYSSNPCTDYYFNEIKDQRLLICTDVGLVVKKEPEKQRFFTYVSRISTAEPLGGAKVTLYDYQGNELTTNYSNSNGFAFLNTKDVPFLIKAVSPDGQAVYMHLLEEKALSLSTFQVEGKNWGSGSKLFFFGDRNVWRPGDTSFIHCVYFDEKENLPSRFPLQVKLKDPRGRTMKEWTVKDHKLGLFDLRFSTDMNDPTGLWKLEVGLGNEVHTHPIRIETIRPNRLKFSMNFANEDLISSTDSRDANVEVKWMHGLEAGGLSTEINMQQRSLQNPFGAYFENFVFDDVSKSYSTDMGLVKTANTNEKGIVTFAIPIEEGDYYPSQMRFSFRLRSFEKGGAFSTDVKTVKYSPYTKYAGIKWPGNMTHNRVTVETGKNIQLICVDEKGKKATGNLTVTVYDIKSSWWYQYGRNGMDYSAIKNNYKTKPEVFKVNVGKEGKPFSLKGRGTKHVVVRCEESGHTVSRDVYLHDPYYWDQAGEEAEQVEVLPFLIEDTDYTAGEILRFDLPPATDGKYMITVENGGAIVHDEMHHASKSPTSVAIRIEENMSPTAYVHVHYIAAYNTHNSHRPLRLFGIQPIKVYAPETILEPEIQMAEEIRTDRAFDIRIKEKSGKRMAYTVAIVDEGLLDITQFKTPDAWSHFFAKEALNVKTWDMYRDIFHRFLGEYTSLLAVGGDEAKTISPQAKAKRFKPAVKFIGPFVLEAGQEAKHTETIKEYVGSVRAMVMATDGRAFGKAEKTSKVIKPLMLYSTLPRVLRPGERVKLPVTVFAMKDHIKNVDVQVKCLNSDVFKEGDTQKLIFDKIGEKDISFWMDTPNEIGVLQFEVTAKSGNETTKERIEIDLNPSSPPITTTINKMAKAGESIDFEFEPIGIKGTNQASLNLSRGLNFSFEPYVDRLSSYPHGCVEQSVSSVFPQIYLSKMGILNDPQQMAFRQKYKAIIQKLRALQLPSGGFSYWPGGNKANAWGTTYALQFLLEAKRMGYDVPNNMLKSAIKYQFDAAGRWAIPSSNSSRNMGGHDLDQAYRLYTLVLAEKPNYGAMNRLRLVPNLNSTSRYILAHAMTLVGEEDAATVLLKKADTKIGKYREFGNTFGSNIRDQALILRVLMERGDKLLAKRVIDELTPYFNGEDNKYLTTQEIAQCMIGFSLFVDNIDKVDKAVPIAVSRANEVLLKTELKEEPQSLSLVLDDKLENKIAIKNEGEVEIFSSLIFSGTPLRDESSGEQNDLEMKVKYKDTNGKEINFKELKLGQDYTIVVSLIHPGERMDYENMALTVMVPPGCEFINTRLMTDIRFNSGSSYDYQDLRDDRVYTYFNLNKGETKEFRFLVNATYEGKYWTPSVFAEAMYDPQIRAKTEGFWTEVGRK